MAKFDNETINFGRLKFTTSTVYVYRSFYDGFGLCLPCGSVVDARWVGQTVQVKMNNGWTYVYEGPGNYSRAWING